MDPLVRGALEQLNKVVIGQEHKIKYEPPFLVLDGQLMHQIGP